MSLIVQNSRTLLKRSQISGATPTVKTGSTQHTDGTWVDTDIYPGEIYWNMQDRIMYIGWEDISGNTGTDVLVTGAGTGSCVTDFYVENVFPCNNLLNLQATDGTNYDNNINITDSSFFGVTLTSTDFTTTSEINITPNDVTINGGGNLQIEVNVPSIGTGTINFARTNNRLQYDLSLGNTTGATPTTIAIIDFSGVFDSVITINANITAVGSGVNLGYGARLFAAFKNIGGVITQLSTTDKSEKTDFTTATSDIVISGTDIIIQVTGEAATNISWRSNFSYHIA